MIGQTLAHYEILAKIGQGGMGEVYRARDTKLDREVALKLLPAEFSHDPERLARFKREATTLAKLQHTNIASVYGFEEDGPHRILVMELVEGEELAERLERGALPVEDAIDIALQLAEGLEVAHAQGIVHRDLKPANVKITATRDVKILDFGLARAYSPEPASGSETQLENSPTITAAMTQAGVILGTAAYMSPEQARGKSIDKQSDIWSFGVVLYEMLTGDQLFLGETISDSIGNILHRTPDLDKLADAPTPLRRLVLRCLQRDKRQRLRDIGDAKLELEDARSGDMEAATSVSSGTVRTGWIAAAVMTVAALALAWMNFSAPPVETPGVTTLGLPRDQAMSYNDQGAWAEFDISPDGSRVAYVGGDDNSLFLRQIDSFETRTISEMDCTLPRFSPDGNWIAFHAESKLWRVAVSGGAPIELCQTSMGGGLAWGPEDLYFPTNNGSNIWSVPIAGGDPRPVSTLNDDDDETSHRWPHVLPDGRHALITIKTADIETLSDAAIGLLDLQTGEHSTLLKGGTSSHYVPTGHIVYGRNSQLFAVGFDADDLVVTGTPVPVLDDVYVPHMNGSAHARISATGHLVYVPDSEVVQNHELVWLELSGRASVLEVTGGPYLNIELSPDGTRFLGMVTAANDKIWVYDLERNTASRLTSTPGNDIQPLWSPDGTQIVYSNDRGGGQDLYLMPADGSAPAQKIVEGPEIDFPSTWSPHHSTLLFVRIKADGDEDIWSVTMDGGYQTEAFLATEYQERWPLFSPDGNWVTYLSDVSGDPLLFVRPFPGPGNAVRVSTKRATGHRWSPDGKTIYYGDTVDVFAVDIDTSDGTARIGEPQLVFALDPSFFGSSPLHPDGTRFLANRLDPRDRKQYQMRMIFDWTERLRNLN